MIFLKFLHAIYFLPTAFTRSKFCHLYSRPTPTVASLPHSHASTQTAASTAAQERTWRRRRRRERGVGPTEIERWGRDHLFTESEFKYNVYNICSLVRYNIASWWTVEFHSPIYSNRLIKPVSMIFLLLINLLLLQKMSIILAKQSCRSPSILRRCKYTFLKKFWRS